MGHKSRSEKASGEAQARNQADRQRVRTKRQVPQGAINGTDAVKAQKESATAPK